MTTLIQRSALGEPAHSRRTSRRMPWLRLPWILLLAALVSVSCGPKPAAIPESQFAAKIVGDWLGTVGDMKETISFHADGGFVSQVRPLGFISNTLEQGVTGTIRGTWAIHGRVMTLNITNAENERLLNKSTSSTIDRFQPNELSVTSARGETSTFGRVL